MTRKKTKPAPEDPADDQLPDVSPEERRRLISEAAYDLAEGRGFADGDHDEDWYRAEREVDARLAAQSTPPAAEPADDV